MDNFVSVIDKTIIIILFFIAGCLLQHISHELLHVFVGKKMGLTLNKIQWFTFHGGTKVFFDDEEQILELDKDIPKEWIYTNLAGIIGTTILAYLFCAVYFWLDIGYLKLFLWELGIIFLLTDSSYALVCSFGNCGDLFFVNKNLKSKRTLRCLSILLFVFNCFVTYFIWNHY